MQKVDFLIIGTGIAGLTAAHVLGGKGSVMVLTKGKLKEANTYWAQGGIAAVRVKGDNFKSHIDDTMTAGANHNDRAAVEFLVKNAPKAIDFLKYIGVEFQDMPALEGGHSKPRVWRTSDFTGQDILNALIKIVRKDRNIAVEENAEAVELITWGKRCAGAFVRKDGNETLEPLFAKHVILATGGLGQLFSRTTNTLGSAGDGLALAISAGLEMKDLEFIQFHPTAFAHPDKGRYFLLSEALRGFGAKIVNNAGEQFLQNFHKKAELAPRDTVARAVFFELMNGPVYLSMRHLDAQKVKEHFPNIFKRLKTYGFDLARDLVPITPVAHYACGGIPVNLKSETKFPGLYAVGEVACTGVHGANRLASNSLLEAVVFAQALKPENRPQASLPDELKIPQIQTEDINQVKAYAARLGQVMWEKAGLIRSIRELEEAKQDIIAIPSKDYRMEHRQLVCYKIADACLNRTESLGAHYITKNL